MTGFSLALAGIAAVVLALPFRHLGVLGGLAVDRPRGAVIVRRRHARLVVDVSEDLKAEFGILVEQLQPARHVLPAIFLYEILVRQQALEPRADLFAPAWSRVALEDGSAIRTRTDRGHTA